MEREVIESLPAEVKIAVMPALKVLADSGLFSLIARANESRLLNGRMDSDDLNAIAKEVQEVRQTNRSLLGFEATIKDITKGIENA